MNRLLVAKTTNRFIELTIAELKQNNESQQDEVALLKSLSH